MTAMVTERGEQHGLINTVGNSVADNDFKYMSEATKAKAVKLRKEESRMVKARYINHRGSHERLDKHYCRWPGDPIKFYHLIPEETYELPLGLVNEINDPHRIPPIRSEILDSKGNPTLKDSKGLRIHELVPVSF